MDEIAFKVPHHHGIDIAVVLLDTTDLVFRQLYCTEFTGTQSGRKATGAVESDLIHLYPLLILWF